MYIRYDYRDEKGQTRRERNERIAEHLPHVEAPPLNVPEYGRYLWDWYFDLSKRLRRVRDGVCDPIPPSEFIAWRAATGEIVYPREYATLCAMDDAYCEEMGKELRDYQARLDDERKAAAEKSKRGR